MAEVFLTPSLVVECLPATFPLRNLPLSAPSVGKDVALSLSLEEVVDGSTEPKMSLTSMSIAELRPSTAFEDVSLGDEDTLPKLDSTEEKKALSPTRGDDEAETPILLFRPPGVVREEPELAL